MEYRIKEKQELTAEGLVLSVFLHAELQELTQQE
jgi:hypothetical protein